MERNIKDVMSSMTLNHLKELAKSFEIQVIGTKKNDFIESVSLYIKNNISVIFDNFIFYNEYEFIRKLCIENYKKILKEDDGVDHSIIESLEYLGIIYSYSLDNNRIIVIPCELRLYIKIKIFNIDTYDYAMEKQNLIDLFINILDIYGVVPVDVLIDYIIKYIGSEEKVHEYIGFLWRYNFRYNLYYIDHKLNYYNAKILNLKVINEKLISNLGLNYKYYTKNELENIRDENLNCIEKEIYNILKRYFKYTKFAMEYLEEIRILVKNDISSEEINKIIVKKLKKIGESRRKIIEKYIEHLREYYPLWGLKGHCLKDLYLVEKIRIL